MQRQQQELQQTRWKFGSGGSSRNCIHCNNGKEHIDCQPFDVKLPPPVSPPLRVSSTTQVSTPLVSTPDFMTHDSSWTQRPTDTSTGTSLERTFMLEVLLAADVAAREARKPRTGSDFLKAPGAELFQNNSNKTQRCSDPRALNVPYGITEDIPFNNNGRLRKYSFALNFCVCVS